MGDWSCGRHGRRCCRSSQGRFEQYGLRPDRWSAYTTGRSALRYDDYGFWRAAEASQSRGRARCAKRNAMEIEGRAQRWTSARSAGLPGPHRHSPGDEPVADAVTTARGLRWRMAARAARDEPRCRRRRGARRERVDCDAHGARDARSGGARGVRAPRGVRHSIRRDRAGD
jgi:hypothetical protein